MVWGVGAFTQGVMQALREDGARVSAWLSRPYAHYGPGLEGPTFPLQRYPDPLELLQRRRVDLIVPMSLDWAVQPWSSRFLELEVPILCPTGEGLRLERERDFGRALCERFGVPVAPAHRFDTKAAATAFVRRHRGGWVIKNPLCSPFSPIHTILCESAEETLAWLERVDDREGVFLQAYLGRAEAGHVALVAGGRVVPLVTNQEYKRAFDGDQGIVAGAPLGGIVERDPDDRYGLAQELIEPLTPWFRETDYRGPVQVTAVRHQERWHVIEYNVRLGVTSGPLLLRLLANPLAVLSEVAQGRTPHPRWRRGLRFGVSITLAGYGYPYVQIQGPELPVELTGPTPPHTWLWWGEVRRDRRSRLWAAGHRLVDAAAVADRLSSALNAAYEAIRRVQAPNAYHRLDIGRSLWPPGTV